ncbi:non-homologous end-joining DNA ligase [Gaetbulibacter aestuarii]|uniref:Non-homologous end-joining DNA ligase n=1 Tax=Gaetbulibacter aestuarii TaxID=1502358 RepID=A0ABW7MYY0_9FLAO
MESPATSPLVWQIDDHDLVISNPKKIYWPGEGISKLELLEYYKAMAPTLLPYFKERPFTVQFFPRGINDFSYYKRNFDEESDHYDHFTTASYDEISQHKSIQVPLLDKAIGLLWLASKGGIEFHLWGSKMPDYEYPDMVIFDLDISPKTNFKKVLEAALHLRDLLKEHGLKSFSKTSGGKGLHVYVPIKAKYSFEFVREWAKTIDQELMDRYPRLITSERQGQKTHAGDKVTIDYMQNVISRNTAAPYTVRAFKKAPVSAPISWEEVAKAHITPADFTIKNMPERLQNIGDIFKPVLTLKQDVSL